jgi:ATP-dependent Clp protease protease subunit
MDLEHLTKNYLDVPNRTIYFFFEVDEITSCFLIKSLLNLDASPGDITLLINSPGGDIVSGVGIIDTILGLKNRVNAHIIGQGASMAIDIFLACDYRTMTPRSTILIHSGSATVDGDMASVKNQSDAIQLELKKSIEFYLKRIKITKPKLKKLLLSDTILDSKTALKYGFVDEIIENKKKFEIEEND